MWLARGAVVVLGVNCCSVTAADAPLWFDGARPSLQARQAVELLAAAASHGLAPQDYDANTLLHVYRAIDSLEKSDAIEHRQIAYSDAQGVFLIAAAMLLIAEILLRGGYLRGAP